MTELQTLGGLDDAHRGALLVPARERRTRARYRSLVEPLIRFLVASQGVATVAASSRRGSLI